MYYVYLLKNQHTNQTYVGYTEDLKRRVKEHAWRESKLVYYEAYKSEKDARNRERTLKQRGNSVKTLKLRLSGSLE